MSAEQLFVALNSGLEAGAVRCSLFLSLFAAEANPSSVSTLVLGMLASPCTGSPLPNTPPRCWGALARKSSAETPVPCSSGEFGD